MVRHIIDFETRTLVTQMSTTDNPLNFYYTIIGCVRSREIIASCVSICENNVLVCVYHSSPILCARLASYRKHMGE